MRSERHDGSGPAGGGGTWAHGGDVSLVTCHPTRHFKSRVSNHLVPHAHTRNVTLASAASPTAIPLTSTPVRQMPVSKVAVTKSIVTTTRRWFLRRGSVRLLQFITGGRKGWRHLASCERRMRAVRLKMMRRLRLDWGGDRELRRCCCQMRGGGGGAGGGWMR